MKHEKSCFSKVEENEDTRIKMHLHHEILQKVRVVMQFVLQTSDKRSDHAKYIF